MKWRLKLKLNDDEIEADGNEIKVDGDEFKDGFDEGQLADVELEKKSMREGYN